MTLTWDRAEVPAQTYDAFEESQTPWSGGLTTAVFAIAAVMGYVANLGYAPMVALAGILAVPTLRFSRPWRPVVFALIVLVVWALVSMKWSLAAVDPASLRKYKNLERLTPAKLVLQLGFYCAFVAAAASLSRRWAERAGLVLGVGVLALAAMIAFEALRGAELYLWIKQALGQPTRPDLAARNVARGGYVGVMLMWVACAFLMERGSKAAVVFLVGLLFVGVAVFNTDAVLAAMGVGLAVFLCVRMLGPIGVWLLAAGSAVYFVAAPYVVLAGVQHGLFAYLHPHVGPSWGARLNIWSFTAAKIVEKPWTGWGLDSSRMFGLAIPLHTHDGALQIWLELGLVGALIVSAIWACILAPVAVFARTDRVLAAVCAATAASYLTVGALSFGVWQEWWLALGALAFAACAVLARARAERSPPEITFLEPL